MMLTQFVIVEYWMRPSYQPAPAAAAGFAAPGAPSRETAMSSARPARAKGLRSSRREPARDDDTVGLLQLCPGTTPGP